MDVQEKKCFKCNRVLPLSNFYRHKEMSDGHVNKCKEYARTDAFNDRHIKFTERIRAYDRERAKRPERKKHAAEILKKYRRKYTGRCSANTKLLRSIDAGTTIKPDVCQICGTPNPVAHHRDYNQPLDVLWVCQSCHRKIHVQISRGELPPIIEQTEQTRIQNRINSNNSRKHKEA